MLNAAYNANYQIVQAPGQVMILTEMIHDVRIIPLDGRPQPHRNVRQWMGVSRGRWEGNTLVVETTNFNGKNPLEGSSENMRVTERFTRVADDTIRYTFTVDDPSTWTRAWTAEMPHADRPRDRCSSTRVTRGTTACTTRWSAPGSRRRRPPRPPPAGTKM